jgi:predicted DNA repair protein MutK
MPHFLTLLSYIGTAAMLWVGAEIIAHGIPFLHHGLEQIHDSLAQTPVIAWAATVSLCAAGGLVLGAILKKLLVAIRKLRQRM